MPSAVVSFDNQIVMPYLAVGSFATKNGVTDTSRMVEEFIARSKIPYNEYSALWIEKGYPVARTSYLMVSKLNELASCASYQIFAYLRVVQPKKPRGLGLSRGTRLNRSSPMP